MASATTRSREEKARTRIGWTARHRPDIKGQQDTRADPELSQQRGRVAAPGVASTADNGQAPRKRRTKGGRAEPPRAEPPRAETKRGQKHHPSRERRRFSRGKLTAITGGS